MLLRLQRWLVTCSWRMKTLFQIWKGLGRKVLIFTYFTKLLILSHPHPILFIYVSSFHPLINSPTTKHYISIYPVPLPTH